MKPRPMIRLLAGLIVAAPSRRYTDGMADASATSDEVLSGRLYVYVAFDWGEEIDLELARQRGAGVVLAMTRRSRTPASIAYRPPPLRFPLEPAAAELPNLTGRPFHSADATVFDFAGVSLALQL